MSKRSRWVASSLAAVMLAGAAAGCTKGGGDEAKVGATAAPTASPTATAAAGNEPVYPMKGNVKLKFWFPLAANTSATAKNLAETEFAQELKKRTGVEVEYIHPAPGKEGEQLNLMIASGDLPDIIWNDWTKYPGGPEKAIADNVIAKLNDVQSKYAPNYTAYLKQHPDIDKMVKTDAGSYYSFPIIKGDTSILVSAGPSMRKDWLDELGLPIPTTMDEWYTVLKAFKEKEGAVAPFSPYWSFQGNVLPWGTFVGAYGITKGFFVDNGKVKYGSIEPAYKDFLATMNVWFKEKLLDNNFATLDTKTVDANILDGRSGATVSSHASGVAKWMTAMKDKDPKFQIVGVPYPVLKKGDTPQFGQYSLPYIGFGAAISAKSKNKEAAAMFLDYLYSEAGSMLANFGIEGVSFALVNGKPKYTEQITNNPNKLPVSQAMARYMLSHDMGPFVQNPDVLQTMTDAQTNAVKAWAATDAAKHFMPPVFVAADEQEKMATIMNEVNTYENEMLLKFVMGSESLDGFDKYVAQMKKLGIDKAIEMQQAALDRYNKR
ncbi:extracellular solute-binding protein [Paenibacillus cymbidii]|uniref:extracellular solute-binding protein n=1 Tax=Paenibacillus cymbidii TaxID=1639034 RepID=UPI0010810126|nr:extracellular solute-binding protein [Paenibacillus cymbidii]